jgi:hypothetical protein
MDLNGDLIAFALGVLFMLVVSPFAVPRAIKKMKLDWARRSSSEEGDAGKH